MFLIKTTLKLLKNSSLKITRLIGETELEGGLSKTIQLCKQSPKGAGGEWLSLIKPLTQLKEHVRFLIHQFQKKYMDHRILFER